MNKSIIVYFSHKGQTYFLTGYKMVDKGNAQIIAETAQKVLGNNTPIKEIVTVQQYPQEYEACCRMAEQEQELNIYPQLTNYLPEIEDFENIILIYPCWYGTMPRAVFSLLKKRNLQGKNIYPICTHEGSGMGSSEKDLTQLCEGANIKQGLAIRGSNSYSCEKTLQAYLK